MIKRAENGVKRRFLAIPWATRQAEPQSALCALR